MTPYRAKDEFEGRPELLKKKHRAETLVRLAIYATLIAVLSGGGILVFNAVQALQTRQQIVGCTTPGNKCYEDGQKRTAALVAELVAAGQAGDAETQLVVLLANLCVEEPNIRDETDIDRRFDLLAACVEQGKEELQ